jgi:hypothetical protein
LHFNELYENSQLFLSPIFKRQPQTLQKFMINFTRLKILFALCFSLFCTSRANAQYATAAAYPFKASTTAYNYLVGGTPVGSWNYSWSYGWVPSGVPIGFTFNFAGTGYTDVYPSTKGYITFLNPNTYYSAPYSSYYTSGVGGSVGICAGWGEGSGVDASNSPCTYATVGTAPNRVFILEYKNWGTVNYTTGFISYQYRLYEQGAIEIVYQRESGTGRFGTYSYGSVPCTIGIFKSGSDYQTLNNASATPTSSSTTLTTNINSNPASGQSYLWGEVPCGTINTSVDGLSPICKGKTFSLNLTNNLHIYSGLTYQWQSSADNTIWTNITGGTSGSITDAITTPKYYRAIVTCAGSGQVYTTASKLIDTAKFYLCYCDGSVATSPAGVTDIGNVRIISYPTGDTILNNGAQLPLFSNSGANKSYSDFRRELTPVPLYGDSSYRIRIYQVSGNNTFTPSRAAVYIDYNRNRTFEQQERVLLESTSVTPPFPGMVTDTFKLPLNIDSTNWYGVTGMRVILSAGLFPDPDTCAPYTDGETEDYLIDLRYPPCDGIPNAGAVIGDTSMCIGYDYVLTDTTYQKKKYGLSRVWEESADNVTWSEIAASADKDTIIKVFTGQPKYYRVKIKCSNTGDSAFSGVHKVNVKPTYKCYCHSQSMGGAKDSSDVGGFTLEDFTYNYGGSHLENPRSWHKRQDFTDISPIEMFVDSIYEFSIFHTQLNNRHGDAKITVFVDFNNNKVYDIPEERIYTGFTTVGSFNLLGHVVIPNTVITDVPTGMRLVLNNDIAPNIESDEACGEYVSGETEDYIVKFVRRFPSNVNELGSLNNVSVYPNPTSDKFTVGFSSLKAGVVKIRVNNVTRQQLLSEVYNEAAGNHSHELDMSGRARGVYFVELETDGIKTTSRIVLQ